MSPPAPSSYETIRYEPVAGVATLTLDRPERLNAMTPTMLAELHDAFDRADGDDEVRVVIVTGGGRGFCAGADLRRRDDTFDYGDRQGAEDAPVDLGGLLAMRIMNAAKPTIAAVNGPAVGAGATLTLPMDVRIASTEARFGFVFTRRGIVPESCSSWFLPRVVGIGQALEWVSTGRVFGAEEALAGGLVQRLYAPDDLLGAAQALAHEIADHTAPVSVAVSRRLLWDMLSCGPMEAHRRESRGIFLRGMAGDAREGVDAFREKRAARFPDRVSDGLPDLTRPTPPPAA